MKIKLNIILLILLPLSLYSHSLLLNIMDNKDGTILVSGAFDTGESAAGAMVKIQAINSDEILYQKRLDNEGELNLKIPKVPYQIILDAGEGEDIIAKDGIPPKEGFIVDTKKKKNTKGNSDVSTSNAVIISIIIAFILLFATLFMSAKNTNALIRELQNNR
jgi:hypothetical protein